MPAATLTAEQKIFYTLRIAVAMTFIGHGAFGIITKPIWCNYFAVIGVGSATAYKLMPIVGSIDIFAGILMLIFPLRIIPAWLVIWGFITACLRPLSGEPFAELIERAGNFGAPLALLFLTAGLDKRGPGLYRTLLVKLQRPTEFSPEQLIRVEYVLRTAGFLLLAGHGWLNLIEKKGLIAQYTAIGFHHPSTIAQAAGLFEIAGALFLLFRPLRFLLLTLLIWKMGTELFYPHYEIFEWVERGGSYAVLLALWFLTSRLKALRPAYTPLAT